MDHYTESTDPNIGLLYNQYYNLPSKISQFLSIIERYYDNYDTTKIDLKEELDKFKKDVEIDQKGSPIDGHKLDNIKKRLKITKHNIEILLKKMERIKTKLKAGKNYISGILIKPKIFQNSIDEDKEQNVNNVVRITNRSLDWVEKTMFDLMNYVDRDINLVKLIECLYYKKVYESYQDFMDQIILEDGEEDIIEDDENKDEETGANIDDDNKPEDKVEDKKPNTTNILDMDITDKSEIEYFPIFSIIYSYDFDKIDKATKLQKACINRGKVIEALTKGDAYSHTLISFDTSFETVYHLVGTGFESVNLATDPAAEVTKSIYVNVTFVTKEEKDTIMQTVNSYDLNRDETVYDLLQLINQFIGKATHKNKWQICSTMVGYLLAKGNAKNVHRDYSLLRPEDITILPRAFYVINFKNKDDFLKRKSEFKSRVKKIYDENIDEIREYNNILPKIALTNYIDNCKNPNFIDKYFANWAKKLLEKNRAKDGKVTE